MRRIPAPSATLPAPTAPFTMPPSRPLDIEPILATLRDALARQDATIAALRQVIDQTRAEVAARPSGPLVVHVRRNGAGEIAELTIDRAPPPGAPRPSTAEIIGTELDR